MAEQLPPLVAHLMADITHYQAEMAKASATAKAETSASSKAFDGLAQAGKIAFLGIGAAAIAGGIASVKMAGDFEAATVRLVTSAGEVRGNLELVRKGMLDMAGQVGYSAADLAKAMYIVESAGKHGADALVILRAAAEGAKTENADLTVVADAVTTALTDYHLSADKAALVTSKLVAAVGSGKSTFQELTGSMHSVLPVASAVGISINDILGSLASMTVHGISAQQAAENLTDVIRHMINPTALQAKELALLGLTTTQLAGDLKSKGLSGTLLEITQRIQNLMPPGTDRVILNLKTALQGLSPAVQSLGMHLFDGSMTMKEYGKAALALDPISAKQASSFATLAGATHRIGDQQLTGAQVMQNYGQALAKATGDSTGLNVALMLTGENSAYTKQAINNVASAATEAGNHVKGWGEVQGTFNQRLARNREALGALAIEIGTALIPKVSAAMDGMANFTDNLKKGYPPAVALASIVGGLLTAAILAYLVQVTKSIAVTTINTTRMAVQGTAYVATRSALLLYNAALVISNFAQDLNTFALQRGYLGTLKYVAGLVLSKAAQLANTVALGLSSAALGVWAAAQAFGNLVLERGVIGAILYVTWQGIVKVATLAWAAVQWILNAALTANPIGIVIVAIALLVAGIVWAYQNVGWFRDAVNHVWDALKGFASWVGSVLGPVLQGLAQLAGQVGGALNAINPFAHHSPSLVEQVEAGTRLISGYYGSMADAIVGHATTAKGALSGLGGASASPLVLTGGSSGGGAYTSSASSTGTLGLGTFGSITDSNGNPESPTEILWQLLIVVQNAYALLNRQRGLSTEAYGRVVTTPG